jgi:exopolyphosphatase/guanosine-5'-triphosphate,3'-diphosphate pyrophosphatase
MSIRASIDCLKRFCSLCQREGVQEIAAVGTNALRMARDTDSFIQQVTKECGITPRVIGEQEEASLSFLSVQQDPHMPREAVVMDVGGGSTEYIFRTKKNPSQPLQCISLPLGALRFTEEFLHSDLPFSDEITKLRNKIDKALLHIPRTIEGALVGIGGTASTLGSMHLGLDIFDQERIHGLQLTLDTLRVHAKQLQEKDLATRTLIKGLPPERADIILAGTMIIYCTMERLKKEAIHLSCHGLRYGLFYQRFMGAE